jgi:hypothetical protein
MTVQRMNMTVLAVLAAGLVLAVAGCKTLDLIEITEAPYKTVYGQGEELNLAGLTVVGTYSDDTSKRVQVSSSQVSGYDKNRTGEQTVAVKISGAIASFRVTVKPLLSISVSGPTKTLYKQDEPLDITGLYVMGTWEDMGEGPLPVTMANVAGYNPNMTGDQIITVTVALKKTTFKVSVRPLASIVITHLPAKTLYKQGESLDLSGLVVTGKWEDIGEQTMRITENNVSGYNANTTGTQTLTVTFSEKRVSFTVGVRALSSINITRMPAKIVYRVGDPLDLEGLVVKGIWEDIGEEEIKITADNVNGFDSTVTGIQTLTVTAEKHTTTFMVTVKALSSIAVTKQPSKNTYETGEELDITGMAVTGTFTDATKEVIPVKLSNVSGYNASQGGQQTLVVTIDEKITTFTVTVRVLLSIDVSRVPYKILYKQGESLDTEGLIILGTYSDRSTKILTADAYTITGFDSAKPGEQNLFVVTADGKTAVFKVTIL